MSAAVFPAARIAVAIGKSKRAIQQSLRSLKPTSCIVVRGQQADAWSINDLPARLVRQLDATAEKRGYSNAERLLADPPQRWEPVDRSGQVVQVGDIAQHHIKNAARLRAALRVTLECRDRLHEPEVRLHALAEFRREFGQASKRHWQRLLKEVIHRDAGEERFDDICLYVDKVVTRKPEARGKIAVASTAADRTLLDALADVRDLAAPTLDERAVIWTVSGEFIDDAIGHGQTEKRARRRVQELIGHSRVTMARNDGEALAKAIKRKYRAWCEQDRTIAAVEDRRQKKFGRSGWHRRVDLKSTGDFDKITAKSLIECGGRLSDGVRALRESGDLSSAFTAHHTANPRSRAYVPASVRRAVGPELKRLEPIHRGPRENRLSGAYHQIDWSKVAAGDFYSADDLTPPVYFYDIVDGRVTVMRGQLLAAIDERTTSILGIAMLNSPTYTSADIFNLFTDVFSKFGLPRMGLIFENGLWRRSRLVKGRRDANPDGNSDLGLRRLVGRIVHAKLPRGKNVERVFGLLQDEMERLPGYSSRNERMIRNERFEKLKRDVEAGRVDPADHLLSYTQIIDVYTRLCEQYNDTPQQGVKLADGTPRQAWEQLQSTPLTRFDDSSLWLLSVDPQKCTISRRHGIQLTLPKIGRVRYVGAETGRRAGEQVLAWVNPRRPDVLCCTTLDKREVFTLERYNPLEGRVDAANFDAEDAKIQAHNAHAAERYRTLKNTLGKHHYGQLFVDRWTRRTGVEMRDQQQKITERQRDEERLHRDISKKARRAGLSAIVVPHTRENLESLDDYATARAKLKEKINQQSQ